MKKLFLVITAIVFAVAMMPCAARQGADTRAKEVLDRCEEMPEFPGGEIALFKFIQENLRYPAAAMADSVQGRVIVQFVVDATGKIASPKVVRSLSAECDAEVLRVVRLMPKWNPGKQEGKNVDVRYTLPVMFCTK